MNPCEACAEIICMGICADRVKYNDYLDGIRQQLIELCERVRNDRERKEREKKEYLNRYKNAVKNIIHSRNKKNGLEQKWDRER